MLGKSLVSLPEGRVGVPFENGSQASLKLEIPGVLVKYSEFQVCLLGMLIQRGLGICPWDMYFNSHVIIVIREVWETLP